MRKSFHFLLIVSIATNLTLCHSSEPEILITHIPSSIERHFLGPELWGNRLQDWMIRNGRLTCIDGSQKLRTVFPLQYEINHKRSEFSAKVTLGVLHDEINDSISFAGFIIGAGTLDLDYRARCLIFGRPGYQGGYLAGISNNGKLAILDMDNQLNIIAESPTLKDAFKFNTAEIYLLELSGMVEGNNYSLVLQEKNSGIQVKTLVPIEKVEGNIGLVAHLGNKNNLGSFWFTDFSLYGEKISFYPERTLGPIVSAQHTLSKNILKLTAQMMPVADMDREEVLIEFRSHGKKDWKNQQKAKINRNGYVATFRFENWNDTLDYEYRIGYAFIGNHGKQTEDFYFGTIRKNPEVKNTMVIAAFTGNNNTSWQSNAFDQTSLFFPHSDLIQHVDLHHPDLLFYSGDQLYEGSPSPPDRSGGKSSMLDYLYKWYLWCWAHRELTKDIPSVILPDDHDVYHGNLWGDGGTIPPLNPENNIFPEHYRGGFESHWVQDYGGYRMGTEFVNMVERTQTSHLPDPYDPTPVKNNIGVYYTDIKYGGISFAVLEDRKFKSAPAQILPNDKIVNGFSQIEDYDATQSDRDNAVLLGERQLKFLENWAADWKDTWMKISLSQTIFANVSTYPDSFKTDAGTPRLQPLPRGVIPKDYRVAKDMDSNGWPQSGRNRALGVLRKGFTFMIAGDQHLGSLVHHGTDEWGDAGISFCVPSVANVWPRRWFPPFPGQNHKDGQPPYTGDYLDGFGNHITVLAVSNPYVSDVFPKELNDRAPGYGIVKLNVLDQEITVECWPRHVNPAEAGAEQYPGWPLTFKMAENYGKKEAAWLPTLNCTGLIHPPVIQVISEDTGEIVYTVRADALEYNPKVFKRGKYTIIAGEPGTDKEVILSGIQTGNFKGYTERTVNF